MAKTKKRKSAGEDLRKAVYGYLVRKAKSMGEVYVFKQRELVQYFAPKFKDKGLSENSVITEVARIVRNNKKVTKTGYGEYTYKH